MAARIIITAIGIAGILYGAITVYNKKRAQRHQRRFTFYPVGDEEQQNCVVCMKNLKEEPSVQIPCKHKFHAGCIREVFAQCDGNPEPNASDGESNPQPVKNLTLGVLTSAIAHIEAGVQFLEKNDPNSKRSSKAARAITSAMAGYKKILEELMKKRTKAPGQDDDNISSCSCASN